MIQKGGLCFSMNSTQRNSYVREQITKTLIDMLEEQSLDRISIRTLTDQAGVGRVSFYRNYESKEDILRQESERLIRLWGEQYDHAPTEAFESQFLNLFDFIKHNSRFYRILYRAGLSTILMETIVRVVNPGEEPNNTAAYIKSFWSYGIFGWVNEWIRRDMPESGDQMNAMLMAMQQGNSQNT